MAFLHWKVSIKADSHAHARAMAVQVEKAEALDKDGAKRGLVTELDEAHIVFDLTTAGPKPITAREVAEWVTEFVVQPTANRHEVMSSKPAVKLGK